jgi:hypothetical protein
METRERLAGDGGNSRVLKEEDSVRTGANVFCVALYYQLGCITVYDRALWLKQQLYTFSRGPCHRLLDLL